MDRWKDGCMMVAAGSEGMDRHQSQHFQTQQMGGIPWNVC